MKNTTLTTIQVENTLHIIPADEADLHSLVEPCCCHPTKTHIGPDNTINNIVVHIPVSNNNHPHLKS